VSKTDINHNNYPLSAVKYIMPLKPINKLTCIKISYRW